MDISQLKSRPRSVDDYQEALACIARLKACEDDSIVPKSRLQLMTHGYKTKQVVVWFHGFTNSPAQFTRLGQLCYNQGANVLIPRAPCHGSKDRLNTFIARVTAERLAEYADACVDLASGLGEQITVGGLSMGGVMTAWLAQQRADVHRAIIISPAFGVKGVPTPLTRLFIEVLLALPNFFRWGDPVWMDFTSEPLHCYPRFSSRALGQILRLGYAVQVMARQGEPASPTIWMVTNANDASVNNEIANEVAQFWHENAVAALHTHTFLAELALGHDLIDPLQPRQKIDLVYPVLMGMLQ